MEAKSGCLALALSLIFSPPSFPSFSQTSMYGGGNGEGIMCMAPKLHRGWSGVEELMARIARCHLGFEWVKGSHVTHFHWMMFASGMQEVFVKVSSKWLGFGSISILDIVRHL